MPQLKKYHWKSYHRAMSKRGLALSFQTNREYVLAKDQYTSTVLDNYTSLALSLRDRIVERWINTQQRYHKENLKRVYYLSMEFLIGRLLETNMFNLGLEQQSRKLMEEMGFDFDHIRNQENDAGLGNGGLGRLAACFLDSMATMSIPAHGYGIRYDYGIFHQKIRNGYQIELPDEWLRTGCPWEIARPEYTVQVQFYGRIEQVNENGKQTAKWVDSDNVMAVPYDIPITGYKNDVVNTLRLWSARSTEDFDLSYFNDGDYEKAVSRKILSENISKILYPNDSSMEGRELRLKQEYFFVAASISDIIRRFNIEKNDIHQLDKKIVIQLNDTHPALGPVELMRVLIDKHGFDWEKAWSLTQRVFAYTNHTLMPEALETWSVELLSKVLPRHLQLIYEINDRFMGELALRYPNDPQRLSRMSLIHDGEEKRVRMANIAVVGSKSVNGVSALHSDLLKEKLFKDFHEFYPKKFNNKTNGISQRQWLLKSNPLLAQYINSLIGDKWVTDLSRLIKLLQYEDNKDIHEQWRKIKMENKKYLAGHIKRNMDIRIDPNSLFDVQVKRIHEYKRQLMFGFYIISEYLRITNDPQHFIQPRTFIVGGKAAPAYTFAKLIIKFINAIADIVNADPRAHDRMKVIFMEDYRVSLAELIFPASDLSEQISTAGMEASGTGNMKFMLNGALTIGTLDGANIEIAENVGRDNIFIFGLQAHEADALRLNGYDPMEFVKRSPVLPQIHDLIRDNFFCAHEPGIFEPILKNVFHHDHFLVCADFESYRNMQDNVSKNYRDDRTYWTKKSIVNVANSGPFSSDRTIQQYAREIWDVPFFVS